MNVRSAVGSWLWLTLVSLFVVVLSGSLVNLPAQSFRGSFRGVVTDPHGMQVAGAKVVALNLGTSETREVSTDEQGEYRFIELPAGEYEVSAVAPGLEESRLGHVRVDVGVETLANITLTQEIGRASCRERVYGR